VKGSEKMKTKELDEKLRTLVLNEHTNPWKILQHFRGNLSDQRVLEIVNNLINMWITLYA